VNRYDPYYAQDTEGIHFEVCVDGVFVQAHAGAALLAARFASGGAAPDLMTLFASHRAELECAVRRRVRAKGAETVILRQIDLDLA
jgi:hypothetical protein